jgi:hypothetical protein
MSRRFVSIVRGLAPNFVTDASGGVSVKAHEMGVHRMIQAGAVPLTWMVFASELELERDCARRNGTQSQKRCSITVTQAQPTWLGSCSFSTAIPVQVSDAAENRRPWVSLIVRVTDGTDSIKCK